MKSKEDLCLVPTSKIVSSIVLDIFFKASVFSSSIKWGDSQKTPKCFLSVKFYGYELMKKK